MALDNPRILSNITCALNWQAAKGSAASSTSWPLRLVASRVEIDRGSKRLHPGGTTGFQFQLDSEFEAATEPIAKITLPLGATQLAPFIESITAGQPTVATGDITEAGDTGGAVSNWSFTGLRPGINSGVNATTGRWELYVTVTDETPGAGQAQVSVYRDTARAAANLVAQGSAADSATVTLAAQNSSGLTGTVDLAVVSATNSSITLTIVEVNYVWASQWARYFTIWLDTTQECERLIDCVVDQIRLRGQDLGAIECEIGIAAHDYAVVSTIFSAGVAAQTYDFLAFQHGVFRSDLDGSPVTEYPISAELSVERSHSVIYGGATNPQQIVSEMVSSIRGAFAMRPTDDDDAIFDRAIADSWDSVDLVFTRSAQVASFTLDKVKFDEPKKASIGDGKLDDVSLGYVAVQDSAAAATPPLAIYLRG